MIKDEMKMRSVNYMQKGADRYIVGDVNEFWQI